MDVFPRTNRIINLETLTLPIKLGEMIRSGIHAQPTIRLFSFRLPIVCTTRQPETRSARWMNINIARRLSSLKTSEASFSEAKIQSHPFQKSPHNTCIAAIAAIAAVSVRNTRLPSVMVCPPAASAACSSAGVQPPSGPIISAQRLRRGGDVAQGGGAVQAHH